MARFETGSIDSPGPSPERPYGGSFELPTASVPAEGHGITENNADTTDWYFDPETGNFVDLYSANSAGDRGFIDPDLDTEHVTEATDEVRRAMHQIGLTERQIAEHLELDGESLVDATDQYLVDAAEHAIDIGVSDAPEIVETALVEGALEATGDRPAGTNNPILGLEIDGYGDQVVEGVVKLHTEGAILPDGESAAEVVARVADHAVEDIKGGEGRKSQEGLLSDAVQAYVLGAPKEYVENTIGVDPKIVSEHIRGLPPEQQEFYRTKRREALFTQEAKEKLQASNPELFKGRISEEFEAKLREAGYNAYAIGFNQHDAITDIEDAKKYLEESGGIELGMYNPDQRFLLHDKGHPMEDYPMGYYSPKMGRFVYAFPVEQGIDSAPHNAVAAQDGIPGDTFVKNTRGDMVANAKYCVGFIDGNQVFHPNEAFLSKDKIVNTIETANPYERLTGEQLVAVRDNIADSIAQGIIKYDKTEVVRASKNLAAIQREFERRLLVPQPPHTRGEVDGSITYVTEPDTTIIQNIVKKLQDTDGAPNIALAMYGGHDEIPQEGEVEDEERLRALEALVVLSSISKGVKQVSGSEFGPSVKNPYSTKTNDELTLIVRRMKQTIAELSEHGGDTTEFRKSLGLVGQVIKAREEVKAA